MFKQLYRLIKEQLSLNKKVDKDLILKKLLQDNQLKNQQQPFLLQELEPRYMFDGAAIEAVDLADGVSEQEQIYILNALKQNENAQATESLLEAIEANSEGFTTDYSQFTEVMIIDSRVKDPHILIESVSRHASIEVITSEVDGVDAIAHILAKYQNLEAIHIVSHGAEAQLQLGNVDLTASNLMDYQAQLAQWGQALTEQGDILFYGCNVAEGDKGQAFIDALTALTSADIAASIDFTGAGFLGGDGQLEYQSLVESDEIVTFNQYRGLLANEWIQVGSDIDGNVIGDSLGWSVSMSSDGSRVVMGAYQNDDNGVDAGQVKVYEWDINSSSWIQLGANINGEAAGDELGFSVSISDNGERIAIGARLHDGINGVDSGQARVYEWESTSSSWVQLGVDIDGESVSDSSGYLVSLSADGAILAVSAPGSDGNGTNSGHVKVYQWNGSVWSQLGADIDGESPYDYSGTSIALNDNGSRVVIGAANNSDNGSLSGHVRVYEWNGSSWNQLGVDIAGEAALDQLGWSASMSADGSRIAIGADRNDGNGSNSGHVRIYEWNGSSWNQLGADIDGEATLDYSGSSVSISSNGSRVAIGAPNNDDNGGNSGHVRVYEWDSLSTSWIQVGPDINGKVVNDFVGRSVSISADGSQVAIGASINDGTDSGHVRVYSFVPANNAPVNTVPGAQNIDEDTLLAITGISVTDANNNLATTRLQVNNGVLNVTLSGLATISAGANGSNDLTISGDETDINNTLASLTYQGNLNFNGSDTLTVTSTDATAFSDVDTVDITVNAVNDAPTAANNTVTTSENTDYTFVIGDFNYNDIDNDTIASIQVTSLESVGALKLNNVDVTLNQVISKADIDAGNLTFTPVADQNGTAYDSFQFTVNDGTVDSSASYTMTIDVTVVNDPPDAVSDAFTVISGVPITITPLDNDSDPEMENLQIINLNDGTDHPISPGQTVTLASGTTVKLLADGQRLEVTATGTTENFSYTIEDSPGGGTDSATISLTIADDQASAEAIGFVMTVDTNVTYSGSSNSNTYILPVAGGAGQSYKVFWGDGTSNTYTNGGDITHNYAVSGQYTIAVVGDIDGFNFGNNDRLKVQTVEQWGNVVWSDLDFAFSNTDNVSFNASDTPILTDVTNLSSMFSANNSANLNVSNWDVSNITNMSNMFENATAFNQSLDSWDVSNVTNMFSMFSSATSFNQTLSSWNTSNVTSMSSMFQNATSFNQSIDNWDVSSVTTMNSMFSNATSFNQSLNSWDVSNVTNIGSMFHSATSFNQALNNWDVSNVTHMPFMFFLSTSFNQTLSSWNVSNVTTMAAMFWNATSFNQSLNSWDVSNVTSMTYMFHSATSFDQDLSGFDLSSVTDMSNFLSFSGMSVANYNATLIGWDSALVPSGITIGVDNLYYGASAESARDNLINAKSWTFIGDSLEPTPPVNTVPGAQNIDEDTLLGITGISVTDPNGNLATTRLQVNNGVLNVTLSGAATISAGANGSNDLTISGSETDINNTLASLTYQGNLNFNGSDTLTVTSTDSGGTPLSDIDTVDINVTAVNDAAVISAGSTLNYTENDSATAIDTTIVISDVDDTN
ncbi:BspA family leucine-rich repeat surface protein, partial [Cysteiniphilum halobium]|uniref:BspA family leucine-rich repeat surface protein n=1 Tax=Cysteiniphilum halobium TaxID=2219059 RepID=UPI003F861814